MLEGGLKGFKGGLKGASRGPHLEGGLKEASKGFQGGWSLQR